MMVEEKIKEYKKLNLKLAKILKDPLSSIDEQIKAKKELYQNKIKMLDIIHQKQELRTGVSAREYKIRVKNKVKKPKYSTGIHRLDNLFGGGFETGQFINIAGESFTGKTELAMSICANISNSKKVAWFNFEMGEKNFIKRLDRVLINNVQWDNFYIDEGTRDIERLCNEIDLLAEDNYFCFGIDSRMKLQSLKHKEEYQKYSYISSKLSEFAQTRDVLIFFINQVSEQDIKSKRLAFKSSGDQKYDSDIALFLTLEEDKMGLKAIEDKQRYLVCNKNRQTEKTFRIPINLIEYIYKGISK